MTSRTTKIKDSACSVTVQIRVRRCLNISFSVIFSTTQFSIVRLHVFQNITSLWLVKVLMSCHVHVALTISINCQICRLPEQPGEQHATVYYFHDFFPLKEAYFLKFLISFQISTLNKLAQFV